MLFKDVSSAPCWTHAIPMPARSHQRTQLRTVVCSVSHLQRWCTWGRTNPWRTGADNNVQLNVHQTKKADCRLRLEAAEIHRRPPLAGYMWKGSTSDTLRTTSRRVWHGPLTSTPWQRSVFTTWDVWGTSDSRSFYASMVERLLKGSILTWMVSSSSPPTLTLPTLLPSRRCYGCLKAHAERMRKSCFPQAIHIFNVHQTVANTPFVSICIYIYTDCIYFSAASAQSIWLPIVPCMTTKDNLNLNVQQNFQKLREKK